MNARTVSSNSSKPRHESLPESTLVLDLGTSRLRAAVLVDGRPRVIDWPELGRDIHGVPVVIGWDPEPPRFVLGDEARRLRLAEPTSMIEASPRLLGVRAELAGLAEGGTWQGIAVERGRGGDVQLEFGDECWPTPRLLGLLLQNLAHRIERRFALTIESTLVLVAPGADDPRRRALLQAMRIAGLPEPHLVHSTTAAGLAWWTLERSGQAALGILGLEAMLSRELELRHGPSAKSTSESPPDDDDDEVIEPADDEPESEPAAEPEPEPAEPEPEQAVERVVLVLDLGAGSFDGALLRLDGSSVEVVGARSRLDVGGLDLDERIVQWVFEKFEAANEIDLSSDPLVRARVRDVAEKAKIALTDAERFEVRLPYLWADASGPKHLFCTLERARFERMIADLVEVPAGLARELLADGGLGVDDLDAVVMLGGCSRVPVIQDRIEALIGRVPETELSNRQLDDDFMLRGLALEARRRGRRRPDTQVVELAPHGVWLRSGRGPAKLLIERGTVLPASASVKLAVDTSVGLGWNDAHELWQSNAAGESTDHDQVLAWARGEQFQAALAFRLGGERAEVEVHVELDIDGCLGVRIDERIRGKEAFIRIERRPGLSERALRRFVAEARDRAVQTAQRDRFDAVRRAVQELVRTIEGWQADPKSGLDDATKASVVAWNRDAEAVLAHGELEPMLTALDVFDGLIGTLPAKLRDGVSGRANWAALPQPVEGGTIEHPPEDDYTTTDVLPVLAGWAEVAEGEVEAEVEVEETEVVDAEAEVEVEETEVEVAEVDAEETEVEVGEVVEAEAEVEEAEVEETEVEVGEVVEVVGEAVEAQIEETVEADPVSEIEPEPTLE